MLNGFLYNKKKEKKPFKDITKYYEKDFFDDLKSLNIERAPIVLRVTDFIPEIVKFIQKLVDTEQAYRTSLGNVYFNIKKFNKQYFKVTDSENSESGKTIYTVECVFN